MKREIRIGIFTILMIAGAWASLRFLSGVDLLSNSNTFYAYYQNVDGLQKAASIYIRGVKVGHISDIELSPEHNNDVKVTLSVKNRYDIPAGSQAKIFTDGIMSGVAVEIVMSDEKSILSSGQTLESSHATGLFESASTELAELKEQISTVAEQLDITLKNVDKILVSNTESISILLENMGALSSNANNIIVENQQSIKDIAEGFSTLSNTMGAKSEDIDSMISNLAAVSAQLKESQIVPQMGESVNKLNTLLNDLHSSDGNIGQLINDDGLYDNFVSASANLDSLFVDLKTNPSRYVHFSIFGSKAEKKIRKAEKKSAEEQAKAEKR